MRIGVVLVTFNRKEYLKKALQKYDDQTCVPECICVVNNGSTDGTKELLEQWEKESIKYERIVINSKENTGGSGGFYQGIRFLMENRQLDWIFVSDDDAYPADDMLYQMRKMATDILDDTVVAVCASVGYADGAVSSPHIIRQKTRMGKLISMRVDEAEYQKDFFEISTLTFVGAMMRCSAIAEVGYPDKDYFIYHDDSEYALRLATKGKILCVPHAKIFHDCNNSINIRGTWKAYYELRNRIIMYREHYPRVMLWRLVFSQYIKRLSIVAIIARKYTRSERKLYSSAIKDGLSGTKGLHEIYKPGFSTEK